MKKLLTITAVGVLLTVPATAVQKCVALSSSATTCTLASAYRKAEWNTTCTTNGTSVKVSGVAACSNASGDSAGDIYSEGLLPTIKSSSDTTNVNCWCKMTSPAVSPWVFYSAPTTPSNCALYCADNCLSGLSNHANFRSALFSAMSD